MKNKIITKAVYDQPSGEELPKTVRPAIVQIDGVPFVSPDPASPSHAREINEVVDTLELISE